MILDFETLLKDQSAANKYITQLIKKLEKKSYWSWLKNEYQRESSLDYLQAYPSQGLVNTPFDITDYSHIKKSKLKKNFFEKTLQTWLYYLELFNHPDRLKELFATTKSRYIPPTKKNNVIFSEAKNKGHVIAINQLHRHRA